MKFAIASEVAKKDPDASNATSGGKPKLPATFVEALKDGSRISYIILFVAFYVWSYAISSKWQLATVLVAVAYWVLETIYTTFVAYEDNGE